MKELLENKEDSKGQWIWVVAVRFFGLILLIAPLFLPLRAYFYESIPNLVIPKNDVITASIGLFISAGGKQIGMIINNIGIIINAFTKKMVG